MKTRRGGRFYGVEIRVLEDGWMLPTEHTSLDLQEVLAEAERAKAEGRPTRPLVVDQQTYDDLQEELKKRCWVTPTEPTEVRLLTVRDGEVVSESTGTIGPARTDEGLPR